MPEKANHTIHYPVANEAATQRLGNDISVILKAGDMLALSGDLGTGKSFLARAIIRAMSNNPDLEVPSPTYTICQHYHACIDVAHYDLYRLSDIAELDELGWQEVLETGIAIMEWPEQVFERLPQEAVHIRIFDQGSSERLFEFSGNANLMKRIQHTLNIRAFIQSSPFKNASRTAFAADASARNYELVQHKGETHYLMDAPRMPDGPPDQNGLPYSKIAHLAEEVSAFVAIGKTLRENNLPAPEIYAHDLDQGLLLIENIGDGKIIDDERKPIAERYMASIELLAAMHIKPFSSQIIIDERHTHTVPDFDAGVIVAETDLLLKWYAPEYAKSTITQQQKDDFVSIWNNLAEELTSAEKTLVLRDYHSPNIIWRDHEKGIKRTGLIDFQDALIGPSAYDVASLAQDARVDVSVDLEERLIEHYINLRAGQQSSFDESEFRKAYAIMAAQRATKILGIFVRLKKRDQKPEYMAHLPRISDYLKRSLEHDILRPYGAWLRDVINL